METRHRVHFGDSRELTAVSDDAVDLVVTSPPYPMIEMWDEVFGELNPAITTCLAAGEAQRAFDLMHDELTAVWEEVARVLRPGGIACINIGDATRTVNERFRVYQNHARLVDVFDQLGFDPLPDILWRKPVNSTAKFLGSGMLPPNAYSTLEHEYILIFRNGGVRRSFETGADRRYQAAYFWEERNEWFSDVWMDVTGTVQAVDDAVARERSGAFPFEIPYRLVNMYSVYGDTVLDPFWGTGTTMLAAMVAARNSIGYELDEGFRSVFGDRVCELPSVSARVIRERIGSHETFVANRASSDTALEYEAELYSFPVMTAQETRIRFHVVRDVACDEDVFTVHHRPITDADIESGMEGG